jgi:predicted DNA-binding WGR domain protein
MATRYFEFVGEDTQRQVAAASKFWEVTVDGSTVTVRFGKIGATGQTSVKELASAAEADAQAAKLIGEKTKKGYTEVVS